MEYQKMWVCPDCDEFVDSGDSVCPACGHIKQEVGSKRKPDAEVRERIKEIDKAMKKAQERHDNSEKTGHPILDTIADCQCSVSHLRTVKYNLLWALGEGDT